MAVSEYRVGTGVDAHAFASGVPLVLGGVRIDHPGGLAGHSDGDVIAHALTDALLGAAGMDDIGALFPPDDPDYAGADSIALLAQAWGRVQEAGWELANADVVLIGEEPRLAPHREAMRARLADALGVEPSARRGARDDDRRSRLHRPPRRARGAGRRAAAAMKLRIVTHVEQPSLRGKLPDLWPEFMHHDEVVSAFWPQLYEVFPDFQLWLLDGRRLVGYACTLPVAWDGVPHPEGVRWAVRNGSAGRPTTLCAIVAGLLPEYRGRGVSGAVLGRMTKLAAAHGLDSMIAPVRPTWKERYPLTPIESYAKWRREDGLPYDPWLRTHERLGARVPRDRAAVADGHRHAGRVGGVDGPPVPGGRRLCRPRRARPGPVRERHGHVRRAERLGQAPGRAGAY